MALRQRPVLITGAAGFAGRALADDLAGDEMPVARLGLGAFDNGGDGRTFSCDITDPAALDAAVAAVRPGLTFHLAAIAAPARAAADQRAAWRTNLIGTMNLLDSLSRHAPASRFLLVSSAAVYGSVSRADCPLREHHPAAPVDCYGATKRAAEIATLGKPGEALQVFVARPFNHLGPGQSDDFLPGLLARRVAVIAGGGRAEIRLGNLNGWRDYTDVRDVVRAYRAIVNRGRANRIYNVCSGRAIKVADLVSAFCRHAARPVAIESTSSVADGTLPYLEGSADRLTEECDWRPTISLEQSVADAVSEHLD